MIFAKREKINRLVLGKKIFFLASLFFLFTAGVFAQKTKTLLADGDKAFADKDYFSAAGYYNRAILQDSTDIAVQYKYAEASRLNSLAYRVFWSIFKQYRYSSSN